jgi:lipopolysaccharide export system protein LptA
MGGRHKWWVLSKAAGARSFTVSCLFLPALAGSLILLGRLVSNTAVGDQLFGGKGIPAKGFKIAEPYGPPHETQTKSLLEGGQALVMPDGSAMLSDEVILRTFSETNTLQLIVKARECFYNATNHQVNSAGPIQMQTADGRFTIDGVGFLWQQTNLSLVISNDVHTVIQPESDQPKQGNKAVNSQGPENGPLFISSGQFRYDGSPGGGAGVWRDHVRVTGTNLIVTSRILTAEVPTNERQVRSLVAEQDVNVEYGDLHATGARLHYAPDSGLIRLSGQAAWQAEQKEGRGEELVIDRTNQIFQVNRHAWLKLPSQGLAESGFLSVSNSPATKHSGGTNNFVEISCDSYELRTNNALFHHQVGLEEHVDNTVRGRMTCDNGMTVAFSGTNELQTLSAYRNVIIEEGDKRVTGGRAFYTHTNTTLEMTEDPQWQYGLRQGKGNLLRINTQQNEMLLRGNALMHFPAGEMASQLSPATNLVTNGQPGKGTNEFAEIYCEEYTLRPGTSVFVGGVYASHPEMNLSCEKMTLEVPAVTGTTNVVAEQNVVFDLQTQKGQVHGKGDRAVYAFGVTNLVNSTNLIVNELRLTGAPAILSGTNGTFQNPLVIWDRAKDKLSLPGSEYRIQGYAKAIDTNTFVLPNKKRAK